MKRTIIFLATTVALIAGVILYKKNQPPHIQAEYTIGILQSASHPALDSVRTALIQSLREKMGDSVDFVIKNAEGSVINAHAIAHQFHIDKHFTLFTTIGTLASQALSSVEKERPIIFAAVTDPDGLGIDKATSNVCGTKDSIDLDATIDTLITLVPQAKKIGLLYTADLKSQSTAMHRAIKKRGLQPVHFAMSGETDLHALVELICRKTDAIITPVDTNVALAISLIATIALKYKKPLIVSDTMLVSFGPLAARGVDYAANGIQTAEIIERVISGEEPCQLPFAPASHEHIYINAHTLSTLGIVLDPELKKDIIFV